MCINNCYKDKIYKYQYNGECIKKCPDKTSDINNDYICRDINTETCALTERELISDGNISEIDIEKYAKIYTNEFDYTDNHITVFREKNFTITFYKNEKCISELDMDISEIDFGDCYKNVQNNYSIDDNLVLGIINEKFEEVNYPKMTSFSMYDPHKGNELNINNLCENEMITVNENVQIKLNDRINYDFILHLTKQNIDIFNISDIFYTDICYHFVSPIDRDKSLKDRISLFFPNITLCENGCTIKGVDINNMRAKCECKFSNLIINNILKDNYIYE